LSFQKLTPDFICNALSAQGYEPTGQLFQLNSYENRVYEIHLETAKPVIVKFYRPGRWDENILIDEHQTLKALEEAEIPVVRPHKLEESKGFETLGYADPYYFCVYPKFGGHEEADLTNDHRQWLGRTLARMHNVTHDLNITHRLTINSKTYGDNQLGLILDHEFLPDDLKMNLEDIILLCLDLIDPIMDQGWESFAIHGDCHLGNVLWNDDGPTLVDFDDMVIAPPIQDIWMLFHGDESEQEAQKSKFFEGYEMFREFDYRSFLIVEPLRSLRMIRHTAWIGERFSEEIFKRTFPYFTERKYWEEFLLSMKEQLAALQMIRF
jgi:Ser/Thr protein kinase RdoA (MazF antagonist)